MFGLREADLQVEIEKQISAINAHMKEIDELDQEISALAAKKDPYKKQIAKAENAVRQLHRHLIIAKGISFSTLVLRNAIIWMKEEARRKDITVERRENLTEEIAKLIEGLKDRCEHTFVVGYCGHEGSYSRDYDDFSVGYRRCIVCGTSENSLTSREEIFLKLDKKEGRLIDVTSVSREEERLLGTFDIWQPIEPTIREIFLVEGKIHDYFTNLLATTKKSR
jgi:hypothetical protein